MNIEELLNYLLTPASQMALIMALAELAKRSGFIRTKYIPLLDLGLGLVSGICVFGLMLNCGIAQGAVIGIALGLSACGLFSGVKNVTQKYAKGGLLK